ncbi:GGDEF domain-containing protein [Vibrio ponticus]|uniref:diguanylate cyclase n=1 Tax=Vibrio ponticus TaxID=265668 RepID=A0A3N3DZH7_9VIBR|nr:bacteriohemerythrin [Vibrio ponticus]ROV59802.1 GGDEF domain-containing protein [Vibrio ponticus]
MPQHEIVVFPWNTNFETGIESIDEQHKILFRLVNKLANTLVHENRIEVAEVFDELAAYTVYHFEEEERVWAEYFQQDDWTNQHVKTHQSFLPDINQIKQNAETASWQETIESILQFLIRWLALHILDDDKKMSLVVDELRNDYSLEQAKERAQLKMKGSVGVLIDTVLNMYEELSSHAIELIREKHRRIKAEKDLLALNHQLQKLSITDELSGLYNRRHFMLMIENELQQAKLQQSMLSFISIDLDHFKKLNDSFGHLKGDEAIAKVGQSLNSIFRQSEDLVFRMGGEEFLVVSRNATVDRSLKLAEQTRLAVQQLTIFDQSQQQQVQLSCSIGVFYHTPRPEDDFLYYLDRVDKALYQAKKNGRNTVVKATAS